MVFFFLFSLYQNILSNNLEGGFRMRKNCSGQFFLLPNKIFDENFSPYEFMIYCFLVSVGDSKGVSFWSVPKMAKKCNMCPTTCRNTLKSLEEKGYIDITQRFFENAQQSNIYTVHQI